ncbi:MAG: hypothetical protein P4L10_01455 [Acidobacteriaceae bacterium]|nr:hypothetical protein [Acidobacteriaceae bacterium]
MSSLLRNLILPVVASAAALTIAGCGISSTPAGTTSAAAQPVAATSAGIQGTAHGGYFPISNALVQLWMPGVSGYGSTPTLLSATTTSGSTGSFTLPGSYTCPVGATDIPLYITITGGYPTNLATPNSYLALAAAIGPCSNASNLTGIVVNEITTVATVWSVGQFSSVAQASGVASGSAGAATIGSVTGTTAANGGNIGAPIGTLTAGTWTGSSTNGYLTGSAVSVTNTLAYSNIKNAFNTSFNLANLQSGWAGPGPVPSLSTGTCASGSWSSGYCPAATNITNDVIGAFSTTAKIDSIAGVLAACIQSDGVTADGSPCAAIAALDGNTTTVASAGGVTPLGRALPADTMQISLYMALEPYHYGDTSVAAAQANITSVFNSGTPQIPYTPVLTYAPFDWTLAITYTGLAVNSSATGSLSYLVAPVVDASGNVWIAAPTVSGLYGFTAAGQPIHGGVGYTPWYAANGMSQITDASGNVWAAGGANNVIDKFNITTKTISNIPVNTSPSCGPYNLSLDTSLDFLFVCSKNSTTDSGSLPMNAILNTGTTSAPVYTAYSAVGNPSIGPTASAGSASVLQGAADASGNFWAPDYVTVAPVTVSKLTPNILPSPSSYTTTTYNGYTGTTDNSSAANGIGLDHAGNVWFDSNTAPATLMELTAASSYATVNHYTGGGMSGPSYIAMDGAGDIWMPNGSATAVIASPQYARFFNVTEFNNAGTALTSPGSATTTSGYAHNFGQPKFLAIDGSGNVWVPSYNQAFKITAWSVTGSAITLTASASPGYSVGQYISLYGFTTTTTLNNLQILLTTGTSGATLVGTLYGPGTLPTGSGTENGLVTQGSGVAPNITEIVGAAVPVYTPLGTAPLNNMIGALP